MAAEDPPALTDAAVVVRSGDIQVTLGDLQAFIANVQARRETVPPPNLRTLQAIAQRVLVNRVLASQAEAMGLDKSPEVQRRMQLERESFLRELRLAQVEELGPEPDYEALARETYLTQKDRFVRQPEVHVAHILVDTKERSEDEAKARAEEVRGRVLEDPARFADLAEEYSDDQGSKMYGGDLGWVSADKLVKPFAEAAFALQNPGDVSPVTHSEFGFHVILLKERRPAETMPFEEVKPQIVAFEEQRVKRQRRRDEISKISGMEGVEVDRALLEAYAKQLEVKP